MTDAAPNHPCLELETLIRARYPVIYVVSWEEGRVEQALGEIARKREKKLYLWSIARGIQPSLGDGSPPGKGDARLSDPAPALDHVLESLENAIFVFRDLHLFLNSPPVLRRVREVANYLKDSFKTLIILSPTLHLPFELQKDVTVVEFGLPSREEIGGLLDRSVQDFQRATSRAVELTPELRAQILNAASGLTYNEAENVLAKTLVASGGLTRQDLPLILSEKEQTVRKSGLLEFCRVGEQIDDLGGLDVLKDWLIKRRVAFHDEAREWGLPAPRGLLLIGVQGCGKSLTAKAAASVWGVPLLRMDVGRLFNSLVGSSEQNIRNAISIAESISPAVLWIDEIEKSMSGSQSSGYTDGGTSARVLSTFLTWLQEKTLPVFVVATANNIEQLPPELLRRGRLDEIFFVDLPGDEEREEIFSIHLRKRRMDPAAFDLREISQAAAGFNGAEIEQVVISSLFESYSTGARVDTEVLLESAREIVPLSRTMKESLERLRSWAEGRARRASSAPVTEVEEFVGSRRRLEF